METSFVPENEEYDENDVVFAKERDAAPSPTFPTIEVFSANSRKLPTAALNCVAELICVYSICNTKYTTARFSIASEVILVTLAAARVCALSKSSCPIDAASIINVYGSRMVPIPK